MRKCLLATLLTTAFGISSGCSSDPSQDVKRESDTGDAAAPDASAQGQSGTAPPSAYASSATPERTAAALAVLQEINGTLKQDPSGKATELNLAGRRWADESQVTQILDAFPEVKSLTLEGRKLTDALAPRLAALENLGVLALRETMVGDATLCLLADEPKLKILDIRVGANLTDAGMDALAKIHTLKAVRLVGCDLADAQLVSLVNALPNLAELDLRSSRGFSVATIEAIQSKASLRTLKLGGPEINNAMIGPLAAMTNLTGLSIEDSDIDDAGLVALADLPLKSLVLSGNLFVTDEGLAILKNYTDLQSLNLQDTGVTLLAMSLLPRPETLVSLDLNQTGIRDENVKELFPFTNLKTLSVGSTSITSEGIAQIGRALPRCRILD